MSSTPDEQTLERRLAAVERAVNIDPSSEPDHPTKPDMSRESLDEQVTELAARVDELEAAVQAVRGFLGGVDAVNEEVESRANTAIAAVERLERRLHGEAVESKQPPTAGEYAPGATDEDSGEGEPTRTRADEADDRTLRERLGEQW